MSTHALVDIFHYAKELTDVGVPQEQAQIHAEKLAIIIDNNLATKSDIKNLEVQIEAVNTKLNWLIGLVSVVSLLIGLITTIKPLLAGLLVTH